MQQIFRFLSIFLFSLSSQILISSDNALSERNVSKFRTRIQKALQADQQITEKETLFKTTVMALMREVVTDKKEKDAAKKQAERVQRFSFDGRLNRAQTKDRRSGSWT